MQSYSFNGTLDSGTFNGQSFSGNFSFDDFGLSGSGSEWFSVGNLSMSFLGGTYSLADAAAIAEVAYYDGAFVGLSYTVESTEPKFSLIAGYDDVSQSYFAYETAVIGGSGAGSVIYAPIPEPETYAMLLAGLGLLGIMGRRRKSMQAA